MSKHGVRAGIVLISCLALAIVIFFGSMPRNAEKWTYYASERLQMPFLCDLIWFDMGNDVLQCRIAYALRHDEVTACDTHAYCYRRYFEEHPGSGVNSCDEISNKIYLPELNLSKRDVCKANQNTVVHTLDICQSMNSGSYRDGCFAGQAVFERDASLCKTYITEPRMLASCYVGVAERTKNPSLCEYQQDAWLKDQCIQAATTP